MARKVGEVLEQGGKYFITLDKEDPKGPHVQLHIYLVSDDGTSTLTKFWIPGSNIFELATTLEEFIARLGGFSQTRSETFMIETPTRRV